MVGAAVGVEAGVAVAADVAAAAAGDCDHVVCDPLTVELALHPVGAGHRDASSRARALANRDDWSVVSRFPSLRACRNLRMC